MKPVIDISEFQNGYWDYAKAAQDISYAIIRVGGTGYGESHYLYEDGLFEKHYAGFKAAGVKLGYYFLAGAMDKAGVDKEVALVKKCLANKEVDYPIYYDVEIEAWQGEHGLLSKEKRTELALYFCEQIEKLGYKAGLYTGISFWAYEKIDVQKFEKYSIWIAQYNSFCQYPYPYDLWQYGSGKVSGYADSIDMNQIIEREVEEPVAPSTPEPEPVPEPEPEPAPFTDNYYIVQSGDTLSGIAAKYGTTYTELAEINGISNPNLIYVGQKILLPGAKVEEPVEEKPVEEPKEDYITYTVEPGDTVSGIASRYGTTINQIVTDNNLYNPNIIFVGQKLKVKVK